MGDSNASFAPEVQSNVAWKYVRPHSVIPAPDAIYLCNQAAAFAFR